MLSNHLILCCPLLLLPSILASFRIFSNESVLFHSQIALYTLTIMLLIFLLLDVFWRSDTLSARSSPFITNIYAILTLARISILCWIEVMRVSIHVFLPTLVEKPQLFTTEYDVSCRLVVYKLDCVTYFFFSTLTIYLIWSVLSSIWYMWQHNNLLAIIYFSSPFF